jgi:hypothetical protein
MKNQVEIVLNGFTVAGETFTEEEIWKDPVAVAVVCRRCYDDIEENYFDWLYKLVAVWYCLACQLDASAKQWAAFISNGRFWDGLKHKKPDEYESLEEIIYWVCRYMCRAQRTDDRHYTKAYKCARILQRYAREGLAWTEVPERLEKEGGVDEAYELSAEENRTEAKYDELDDSDSSRKPKTSIIDGEELTDDAGGDRSSPGKGSGRADRAAPMGTRPAKSKQTDEETVAERRGSARNGATKDGRRSKPRPALEFDPELDLVLRMGSPEELAAALNISFDAEGQLWFKRMPHPGTWRKIVAVDLKV